MNRSDRKYAEDGSDEVEDLLRQAEDAALLKLSVNGHMAHHSSPDLPPDLAHRFRSLKSSPSTSKLTPKPIKASTVGAELRGETPCNQIPDDLFARFAALKASLPKPSSTAASSSSPVKEGCNELGVDRGLAKDGYSNENHEDEVDKIMRWAIDAARLDPSPESDVDGNDDDINDTDRELDSSEEEDDDDDYRKKKKKNNQKKK